MSKRHGVSRYTLPDVVNPESRKCISVYVPDNPYHIAAFRGQLEALARAYSWGNDENHTALEVARVWRQIVDNTEECSMDFRQDACHLYIVRGGIETLIYNGQECIDANIRDGKLKPGISNDGLGYKGSSECFTYSMELSPLETFYLPQRVSTGDTLEFVDFSGGTQDISGLEVFWWCPTGGIYAFGNCTGGVRGGSYPDDPASSITHASLIVEINGVFYDLFNAESHATTLVVPSGISNALCKVRLNYGSIVGPTALGTVKATIQWCSAENVCGYSDFTTGTHSWRIVNSAEFGQPASERGTYISGQGYQSVKIVTIGNDTSVLTIAKPFDASKTIDNISITIKQIDVAATISFDLYRRAMLGVNPITGYLSLGTENIPLTFVIHSSDISYTGAGEIFIDMYHQWPNGSGDKRFMVSAVSVSCS